MRVMDQDKDNREISRAKPIVSIGPALMIMLSMLVVMTSVIIGYYSFNNGRKAAINLSKNIQNTIQINIKRELDGFLSVSHAVNKMNAECISIGLVNHNDLEMLKKRFINFSKSFELLKSIAFGSVQGDFIGAGKRGEKNFDFAIADKKKNADYFVYLSNDKGNPIELIKTIKNYDPRKRGWYQSAIEAKGPAWSPIYVWASKTNIGVSAVRPVYNENGAELGVVMSALTLGFISDYLKNFEKLYSEHIYIIDRSGYLIATSSSELLIKDNASESGPALKRVQAEDSTNNLIQESASHLKKYFIDFNKINSRYQSTINIKNQNYYLNATPYSDGKGLDWLIVISTPEKVIMEPLKSGIRNTVILSLMILICAIVMGFFLMRFITRPIAKLNQDIKIQKPGEWKTLQNFSRFKEVNQLTSSYNAMLDELKLSFETLEKKVTDRTTQLSSINMELKHEIKERKRTEETLRKRESDLILAQSIAHLGNWSWDVNNNKIAWSDEMYRIYGVDQNTFSHTIEGVVKLIHPEDLGRQEHAITELLAGRPVEPYEYRAIRPDGTERIVEVVGMQLEISEDNQVRRMFGIAQDITERKRMEEELLRAQKMESIGTLTGGIAHDFNNIMGIILGNTELALEDVPEWNPAHSTLEEIRTASLRAANIVKQLLSFTRITDQKLQPIEIAVIVKDALKFLRSTIPTTIDIEQDIFVTDETILADPTQINQIMMNLCINASHAMEQMGGKLTITVENVLFDDDSAKDYPDLKEGKYVKVMVSDTGPGIDPKIIDRLFDPYFTTKGVGKGSGMGLAVVHGIVKSHSGSITVDSTLGKGTKFIMLFPLAQEKAAVEAETIQEIPRGKETILFVDDEISIAKMAQRMFERLGYKVEMATKPQDALERFTSNPDYFDLVITDMTMPQMTGVDLSEKLMDIRKNIPIIICTGHSALVDEEKAKEMGLAALLMKPINITEMAQTIRKVLDRT